MKCQKEIFILILTIFVLSLCFTKLKQKQENIRSSSLHPLCLPFSASLHPFKIQLVSFFHNLSSYKSTLMPPIAISRPPLLLLQTKVSKPAHYPLTWLNYLPCLIPNPLNTYFPIHYSLPLTDVKYWCYRSKTPW